MSVFVRLHDERGSLPMAMLAILIVGALVTTLTMTVIVGQRSTVRDQNFEQALPAAEFGLDQLIFMVQSGAVDDLGTFTLGPATNAQGDEYTATATLLSDGNWHLTSSGTSRDGVTRTAEVSVEIQGPFRYGAFGRQFFLTRGGGTADQYDTRRTDVAYPSAICKTQGGGGIADPFEASDTDVQMCHPITDPPAIIATNGELTLLGQTIEQVSKVEIHHSTHVDDPRSDATGVCVQTAQACAHEKVEHFREPVVLPLVELPLNLDGEPISPTGAFPSDDATPGAWRADDSDPDAGDSLRRPPCEPAEDKDSCLGPGVHVFTDVTLDFGVDYQGTVDDPVILYVTGKITVPRLQQTEDNRRGVVNFQLNGAGNWEPRPPSTLQIFSMGGGPTLNFGGKASFSGAIYAPHAAFDAEQHGNFYGAMIANSINNSAQWNFHYDAALPEIKTNAPRVAVNWSEVVGS